MRSSEEVAMFGVKDVEPVYGIAAVFTTCEKAKAGKANNKHNANIFFILSSNAARYAGR